MATRTPAELALARSFTSDDGAVRFNVTDLTVDHQADRRVTFTYGLVIERKGRTDESWLFALPWSDKSFNDVLTSSVPDPERLRQLVELVRGLLEEWWDTKDFNRHFAKLGRRCS
ncbi:hypothetical protein [Streptomyces lasiicapitis]|uniref:hypothetical protein n=1 Tax=Streptomyces lasiicapitis TaxID=1923961 RepID=UPI003647FC9A